MRTTNSLTLESDASSISWTFTRLKRNVKNCANNPLTTGLSSYKVDLETKTADVYTDTVPYETVLDTIKKTGKAVTKGEADGKAMAV